MPKNRPEPVMLRQMNLSGRLRPVAIMPASGREQGYIYAVFVDGVVGRAHFETTLRNTSPLTADNVRYEDILEALDYALGEGNYYIVSRRSSKMRREAEERGKRYDAQTPNG